MGDYEGINLIKQIIDKIKAFIQKGDQLFSIVKDCPEHTLVCDLELLRELIRGLIDCWEEIIEGIQNINPQFLDYVSKGAEWMGTIEERFMIAYHEYNLSGLSGNPANTSGFSYWKVFYRERWKEICYMSMQLVTELEKQLENEEFASMGAVYASPELMLGSNSMEEPVMGCVYASPQFMENSSNPLKTIV